MKESETSMRIDRRRFVKLASLVGGGLFLAACAPAAVAPTPTAAPKGAPGSPTPAPKVSANVEFAVTSAGVGPHMIPFLVCHELFLKDEGITQKYTPFAGGGDTARALVTGHQMGNAFAGAIAIAVAEGQPIRIVAENLPFPTILWFVKGDSPIKSMKDIKGKKIGYSRPGSTSQSFLLIALRSMGLDPEKDVQTIAAGGPPEQLTAVRGGILDVGWSTEPIFTSEVTLKKDVRMLDLAANYVPAWSESVIATTEDYAKAHGDVITAYLRAHQKAEEFIVANPDKAGEIWAKGQDVGPEIGKLALKNLPYQKFTSKIDPAILKAIGDDSLATGQIKQLPDWKKIVDQSFLAPGLRTQI